MADETQDGSTEVDSNICTCTLDSFSCSEMLLQKLIESYDLQETETECIPSPLSYICKSWSKLSFPKTPPCTPLEEDLGNIEISLHGENEKQECILYGKLEDFANIFVDDILNTSIEKVLEKKENLDITVSLHDYRKQYDELKTASKIKWPRIFEFTTELGSKCIDDFIKIWKYGDCWHYNIVFIAAQSDDYSDYHLYRVKWCMPYKLYPVARPTASIFFTIEVSRFKPKYCEVDVTYVFEGSRISHYTEEEFKESFLMDIINSKLTLFQRLKI